MVGKGFKKNPNHNHSGLFALPLDFLKPNEGQKRPHSQRASAS